MPNKAALNPSFALSYWLLIGISGGSVVATWIAGYHAVMELASYKVKIMIFDATIEPFVLWIGFLLGVIGLTAIGYWFKYQVYQKDHPDVEVKFNMSYAVAAVLTIVISVLAAYVIVFFGLGYVFDGTVITEPALAFFIALACGMLPTYFIDAVFFHPIADGYVAFAFNKGQAAIREQLASEAAQAALLEAVKSKCVALGLTDEAKIGILYDMVKGDIDNPSFAIYVQLLKGVAAQEPAEQQVA
mgnify:CR=1 FL=1